MIKFKLVKFEKALAFQINYVLESQVNKDPNKDNAIIIDGVSVISSHKPEIVVSNGRLVDIFIWGRSENNNDVSVVYFSDNLIRDSIHDKIIDVLKKWAQSGGFKQSTKKTPEIDSSDTYSF